MGGLDGQGSAASPGGALGLAGKRFTWTLGAALRTVTARLRRSSPDVTWNAVADAVRSFEPGRGGLLLRCGSGSFVVTQSDDPVDHVLEAGEVWRTFRRGRVAAWSLRAGTLVVARPLRAEVPHVAPRRARMW